MSLISTVLAVPGKKELPKPRLFVVIVILLSSILSSDAQ